MTAAREKSPVIYNIGQQLVMKHMGNRVVRNHWNLLREGVGEMGGDEACYVMSFADLQN